VFTLKDVLVLEVKKDIAFTQNMIAKLDKFYYEHFKDAILHRYVYDFMIVIIGRIDVLVLSLHAWKHFINSCAANVLLKQLWNDFPVDCRNAV